MITFGLKGGEMASLNYPCYGSVLLHSDATITLKYFQIGACCVGQWLRVPGFARGASGYWGEEEGKG